MTGEYSLWIRWWNHNHSKSPDFYLFFWPCCTACGILVPQPGIKPMSPALKSWSFNHWTTSEVPMKSDFDNCAVVLWETTNNNQVLGAKFYLILWGPMDCSLSGSSVHEILQARIWSGLLCRPPGDLPNPGIEPTSLMSPAVAGRLFTTGATWEAL